MKKLLVLSAFFILYSPLQSALGQATDPLETIELQKRKVFYKGERIKKIKELESIIHAIDDQQATDLLADYRKFHTATNICAVAIGGITVAMLATGFSGNTGSVSGLNDTKRKTDAYLYAGLGLIGTSIFINTLGWRTKGEPAIRRYNDMVGQSSSIQTGVSLVLIPASSGVGVGVRLEF